MLIVDTHCHASPYWFEPVETLLDQMNRHGVEKAVLTQVLTTYDNTYLLECQQRFPGRFSVVAIVDEEKADAPETLERWTKAGCEGIRIRATVRSPGSDPLAIWRKTSELGIPASCPGGLDDFGTPEFESLVRELPGLNIIMEHLGGVGGGAGLRDVEPPHNRYRKVLSLAKYSNVFIRIPGLGEICPRPMPNRHGFPFVDIPPMIEMAVDAFGAHRIMWGSDFPPVANREGFRNALIGPMEHVSWRSEEDKEWVFGKTAMSLWKFGER